MPYVHNDDGDPCCDDVLGIVVRDAKLVQRIPKQPDVYPPEDLPDGTHNVPWDQERQRHHHQTKTRPKSLFWHIKRDKNAERNFNRKDDAREHHLPPKRIPHPFAVEHVREPFESRPEKLVVPEGVLHRIIHHGHQRNYGRERHEDEHWQHEKPCFLVDGLVHAIASSFAFTRQSSA